MNPSEQASYMYAVARPVPLERLSGLKGVGGLPVHTLTEGDLAAVVSTVPLHTFDEEALQAGLEDLRWLEEIARAHHTVIEALMDQATAVPLRLATVYRDEDRVRQVLRQDQAMFDAVLRRLHDRAEYSVKVYADPVERAAAMAAPSRPEPGESPGKAYLRKRRDQHRRQDDTLRVAADLCESLDPALGVWAEARSRHRPQSTALAEVPGENVLNLAYLVAAEHTAPFLAEVERFRNHAPPGTRVKVSGPFAPYSFASLDAVERVP